MNEIAVRDLLTEWMRGRNSILHEFGGNFQAGADAIIAEAKQRAADIGIEWSDDLIPESMVEEREWSSWEDED